MLQQQTRADLFRLLGDEDRLRLFALCAEEELTISELAELLHDGQPNVSRKAQALRAAGLLAARKDGTRTYLKATVDGDPVVTAALDEGRRLARKDKSLARIPKIVRDREEGSRQFFEQQKKEQEQAPSASPSLLGFLPLLRPLLGEVAQGVCVDVGAGDGLLLPLLSPLFSRVVAVDRSPARLAACAALVAQHDLANVRLLEGDATEPVVHEAVYRQGGAAVVVVARTLHHAARPAELLASCARLLRPRGVLIVVDYLPHDDESMRELGDVWLGFAPEKLMAIAAEAGLAPSSTAAFQAPPGHADSHLAWQWMAATVSETSNPGISQVQ